ncbi:MAG: protein phosphatase 2C domain-containing protein [Firmicutes bacterium]|nr:protein phosphatase 2C domain-containing protein [Bacillota bacterium]MCM1401298.1 protein phosphatase 2C domain-containing protein [Bacteroides sp.]
MITIRQPLWFSEIGQKDNQEDYVYPVNPTPDNRVFILCDGMGGHERGEVASSTVGNTLGQHLDQTIESGKAITAELFDDALTAAYNALEKIPSANSERKPGTTLTAVCFNDSSVLAAHIGDSRIYHIRPSLFDAEAGSTGILYRSEDHSLVNDLVKAGQITPEQARTHPRRNVITRAMQPGLERRFKATIHECSDIQPGDYFFLCSDGVLERITDRTLCEILATPEFTDIEKIDAIKAECALGTRDNYSCSLIPVEDVTEPRRPNYIVPLAILTAIIIIAGCGIAAYYAGYFHPNTDTAIVPDSAVVKSDTSAIDTLVLAVPLTDTLPADTVKPVENVVEKAPVNPDTVASKPKPATTAPDSTPIAKPVAAPATTPTPAAEPAKTVPEPKQKTGSTGSVPKKPQKADSKSVPPRKNNNSKSTPKPLA